MWDVPSKWKKKQKRSAARHKQQFLAMMKTGRDNRERHYFFCFLGFLNTLNRFRVLTVLSVFRTSDSAVEFLNSAPFLGLGGRKIWKMARNSKIVILARNLKMNFGAKFENWRHLSGAKFKNLNFGAKFKNLNFGAKFENLKIGAICRAGNLKKWRELWRHSF